MKISVVIPLYNKATYIRRAIESALAQHKPVDEIIVIDDGSTDGSAEEVLKISDARVRLFHQPNAGECAARNRGIAESVNPYVGFLDADDEWKPDFLNYITKLITLFPGCGAYATSSEIIRSDNTIGFPNLGNIPAEPWMGIIPNFFELFQAGYAFNASSVVIPKDILEEVECFPLGTMISGDVACWVNIAIKYPIAFSPTRSVIYHQEAQNRVGNQYLPIKEMPYIHTIQDAISRNLISKDLQPAALDFIAQKQIFVAIENIMTGNPSYARRLLATCRHTKKYKRDWLWWRIWASFPAGMPLRFMRIKHTFEGFLNR